MFVNVQKLILLLRKILETISYNLYFLYQFIKMQCGESMKFKYFFLFLFSLVLFKSQVILAQDEQLDNLQFEQTNVTEESKEYFGVAGGYTGSLLFLNFDDLDGHIEGYGFGDKKFNSPLYLNGFEGIIPTFFVRNLRIGIFALSGSALLETTIDNAKHSAEFTLGYTGVALDYAIIPFETISLAILPGLAFGGGSLSIEEFSGSKKDWFDIKLPADTKNYLNRMETGFAFIQPRLNIEWAPTSYITIRAGGGYNIWNTSLFKNEWTFNRSAKLENVPSGINATGAVFQFGLFVGIFNY